MTKRMFAVFAVLLAVAAPLVSAEEDVQWVRVTVLLEPGSGGTVRAKETLVPGGIYSLAEVENRGQDAIDKEILDRVRFLGGSPGSITCRSRSASGSLSRSSISTRVSESPSRRSGLSVIERCAKSSFSSRRGLRDPPISPANPSHFRSRMQISKRSWKCFRRSHPSRSSSNNR